jgi:uncharacterized protein YndB with AHSA1/START domain
MTDTMTTQPTIDRTLDLQASPERVWTALTEPEELSSWFGSAADFRPEVGYAGWFEWEGYGRFHVVVDAVEPGRYLSCSWANEPGGPVGEDAARRIEWWLEPRPRGGTVLRLRESGFDAQNDLDENTFGWL